MQNCNDINFDTGQVKTQRQSVWRITITILTVDKIEMNENEKGELQQYHF